VLGEVFPHQQLARVNGLVFSGVGFANALALGSASTVLLPLLGSWQAVLQATAGCTVLLAILWYWHLRRLPDFAIAPDAPHSRAEESLHEPIRDVLRRVVSVRDLWGVALFFALPSFAYWGLLSQFPPVLAARGVADPGLMVATMTGTSVFANILGGYVSDRLGNRRRVLMVCALGLAATLPMALVLEGASVYAIMVLAGLFFGPIIPIALTIPVELPEIGTRYAGSALGFVFMIGNIGAILGPITLGYLIDHTGSPLFAFSVAACCLVASLLPLQLVRETAGVPSRSAQAATLQDAQ
jgi:cyanate permease